MEVVSSVLGTHRAYTLISRMNFVAVNVLFTPKAIRPLVAYVLHIGKVSMFVVMAYLSDGELDQIA